MLKIVDRAFKKLNINIFNNLKEKNGYNAWLEEIFSRFDLKEVLTHWFKKLNKSLAR